MCEVNCDKQRHGEKLGGYLLWFGYLMCHLA